MFGSEYPDENASPASWQTYFSEKLFREENPIGLIALAKNFFYEPNKFCGFLYYLLSRNVTPLRIIQTNIFHEFTQYNYALLNDDESPIRRVFQLLQNTALFELINHQIFPIDNKCLLEYGSWETIFLSEDRHDNYFLPAVVFTNDKDHLIALYACFGVDFIKTFNFSLESAKKLFIDFFQTMFNSSSRDAFLFEFIRMVLCELHHAAARSLFLLIFTEFSKDTSQLRSVELIRANRDFIYIMLAYCSSCSSAETTRHLPVLAGSMIDYLSQKKTELSLTELYLLVNFLTVCPGNYRSQIAAFIFEGFRKIILSNSVELETDAATYGIPLDLLNSFDQTPCANQLAIAAIEKENEQVFEMIARGTSYSAIKSEWHLPVINVFKRFCNGASPARYLTSELALKITVLREMWRLHPQKENFLFSDVFDRIIEKDKNSIQAEKAEKIKILYKTLIDTTDDELIDAVIVALNKISSPEGWVKALLRDTVTSTCLAQSENLTLIKKIPFQYRDFATLFKLANNLTADKLISEYCLKKINFQLYSDEEISTLLGVGLSLKADKYLQAICLSLGINHTLLADLLADNHQSMIEKLRVQVGGRIVDILLRVAAQLDAKKIVMALLAHCKVDYGSVAFSFCIMHREIARDPIFLNAFVAAVVNQKYANTPALFLAGASWWDGRKMDRFYIACALELISKNYAGTRRESLKRLYSLGVPLVDEIKHFLREERYFKGSTKLNLALGELILQIEGKSPVSMTKITRLISGPVVQSTRQNVLC